MRDKKEVDDAEDEDDNNEEPLHRRRVKRPFCLFLVPITVDSVLAEVIVELSRLLPLLLECASSKSPALDEVSAQGFFGNLENEEYGLTFSFCCASLFQLGENTYNLVVSKSQSHGPGSGRR